MAIRLLRPEQTSVRSMERIEVFPQKIVDVKTIILKSRFDSNTIRTEGERLAKGLFEKAGFLKPKPEDGVLVAISKYYEPYLIIGGEYSIDYCKRHDYAIKADGEMQEVFVEGKKLTSEPLAPGEPTRVFRIVGEEHAHYQTETYFVLDRTLREIPPDALPLAPFEFEMENPQTSTYDLRKINISLEEEVAFLRSRIVHRPSDVAEIIKEDFEIKDRTIAYRPIYELIFQNQRSSQNVSVLIDGITGEIVLGKFDSIAKNLTEQPAKAPQVSQTIGEDQFFMEESKQNPPENIAIVSNAGIGGTMQNTVTGKDGSFLPETKSEASSVFNPENATSLAASLLKRLGYKNDIHPIRLERAGDEYIVEIGLERRIAKVKIDANTKEIKEYDLQETEEQTGPRISKEKVLLAVFSILGAVAALKLMNLF